MRTGWTRTRTVYENCPFSTNQSETEISEDHSKYRCQGLTDVSVIRGHTN